MTSKISMNKIPVWTLLKENLRHCTWMIALSLLGSFLASPVAYLYLTDESSRQYTNPMAELTPWEVKERLLSNMVSYLRGGHLLAQMIVLYLGAVIVAVFGFRYLYSRKMVDLCHSTPITRGRLFLVHWLSGFLIWLVPFLAGNLCVLIMILFRIGTPSFFGVILATMGKTVLLCVLSFLIIYNACLVAVMISGNVCNAFVNLLLYGLIVFAGNAVFVEYMHSYFKTFILLPQYVTRPFAVTLSPLSTPFYLGVNFSEKNAFGEWFPTLLLSTVLMCVNFMLALWLYRKRNSELAERGLEAKWFRIPIRFAASVFAGLLLSLFFHTVSRRGGWSLFGVVLGSVIAFVVLNIIYHGGFKYLFSHKLQIVLALALSCGILGIFHYDVFGYETYIPKTEDIKGLSLLCRICMDESYSLRKDGPTSYYTSHESYPMDDLVFTNAEEIHRLLAAMSETNDHPYSNTFSYIQVKVNTTHGSYLRQYPLTSSPEDLEALRPFIENDDYREKYYPASREDWELPEEVELTTLNYYSVLLKDRDRIKQLHEAYRQDFMDSYSIENMPYQYENAVHLNYCYPGRNRNTVVSLRVEENDSRTMALLKEWYPECLWSTEGLELKEIQAAIYLDENNLEALKNYFGLSESTEGNPPVYDTPVAPPAATETYYGYPAATQTQTTGAGYTATMQTPVYGGFHWEIRITDLNELKSWAPYLTIHERNKFFADKLYVNLGTAVYKWKEDENYSTSCYVEQGVLPEALLERLYDAMLLSEEQ